MRTGKTPQQACSEGIARLVEMIDDDHNSKLEQQQQQQRQSQQLRLPIPPHQQQSRMHRRLTVSNH